MKKLLFTLLVTLAMCIPSLASTSKDIEITLGGGVTQIINGVHQDIVQMGTPISKHLVVIPTAQYQADGEDTWGDKLCFYYVDFNKWIKMYISPIERDPVDVLAKGNEAYLGYLLDVGEIVFEDGGISMLIRACLNNWVFQKQENKGVFFIN